MTAVTVYVVTLATNFVLSSQLIYQWHSQNNSMAEDELKEINGIKPNVWLGDGEEREVSSQSRCAN